MNTLEQLHRHFCAFITTTFFLSEEQQKLCSLVLNVDENKQLFGDLSSNIAMILAKQLKKAPREIAQEIVDGYTHEMVKKVEVAGPGFLNIFLTDHAIVTLSQDIFKQKHSFFKPTNLNKDSYNVEFVSANPTGPLHFGHGRGGIIGDVLGNILKFLGHDVTQEFYINDAGKQIQKLGTSFKIRCEQAAGMDSELPEDAYHGEYLKQIAQDLTQEHGGRLLNQPDEFFADYAKTKMLERIKKTLNDYGIYFDEWFSEKSLHDSGAIVDGIKLLEHKGHLYTQDGALWFKSTAFGDDKDRVLKKESGELTYVAADIAYLINKVQRGNNKLIMILGHDHHSYVHRLQALMHALELNASLEVILYQLVKIKESGQLVQMSKRTGKMITLNDVVTAAGTDVARYFYLNRKADAQLEFDLELALKKTDENPAFYIQYAYVRTGSILKKAKDIQELADISPKDLEHLGPDERLLVKKIVSLKQLVEVIGNNHQTHLLAYFTHELAQTFSSYYNQHKVVNPSNIPMSRARLALMHLLRSTLELCLDLMGLSKPERM